MENNMENWRLSRIEEELGKLEIFDIYDEKQSHMQTQQLSITQNAIASSKPTATVSPAKHIRIPSPVGHINVGENGIKMARNQLADDNQPIYVVVQNNVSYEEIPGGKMEKLQATEVVERMTSKYDSLRGKIYQSKSEYSCSDGAYSQSGESTATDDSVLYSDGCIETNRETVRNNIADPIPYDMTPLTDEDINQIEHFYRSLSTEVFPARGIASLYFGQSNSTKDRWDYYNIGIPLLLLDTGDRRRRRKLYIVLAERGTGFILWKDSIDHLSNYKATHHTFHTVHLSSDHTRLAGLSFVDKSSAQDFLTTFKELTSDPDDDILNVSGKGKKKKKDKKKSKKYKPPSKSDISQPCCFNHVTKLERDDKDQVYSLFAVIAEKA